MVSTDIKEIKAMSLIIVLMGSRREFSVKDDSQVSFFKNRVMMMPLTENGKAG